MRQFRLVTLTICGLLCAAAVAQGHDYMFAGPPPGGMPGSAPAGAPAGGMSPGMGPVYPGPQAYPGDASPECCEDGPPDPLGRDEYRHATWSVGFQGVLMRRSRPREFTLAREGIFDLAGAPLLTTKDLPFDHELGPRFDVVLHGESGVDIEFDYFRIDGWNSRAVVVNATEISISSPNILLDNLNAAQFTYSSDFTSWELNARWRVIPRLTLLVGLRSMELTEDFEQVDNFGGLTTFAPSYTIHVKNQLVGAQLGAVASLLRFGDCVSVDGFLKWGYFSNRAEHNMQDLLNLGFGTLSAQNTENTAAWEVGVSLTWRCHEHAKVWLGYDALWVRRLATAPGQIPGNDLLGNAGVAALGPIGAVGVAIDQPLWIDGINAGLEVTF